MNLMSWTKKWLVQHYAVFIPQGKTMSNDGIPVRQFNISLVGLIIDNRRLKCKKM